MIEQWEGKRHRREMFEAVEDPHSDLRKRQLTNISHVVNYDQQKAEWRVKWICILVFLGSDIRSIKYIGVWTIAKQFGGDDINCCLATRRCLHSHLPNYLDLCCEKSILSYGQHYLGAVLTKKDLVEIIQLPGVKQKLRGWAWDRIEIDGAHGKRYARTGCITVVDTENWDLEGEELDPECMLCKWSGFQEHPDGYAYIPYNFHRSSDCLTHVKRMIHRFENVYFIFDGQFFDMMWYRYDSSKDEDPPLITVQTQLRNFIYNEVDHFPVIDGKEHCNL